MSRRLLPAVVAACFFGCGPAPDASSPDGGADKAGDPDGQIDSPGAPSPDGSPAGDAGGDGVVDGGALEPEVDAAPPICTSCDACEESVAIPTRRHLGGDLNYSDPPPAGGDHNPCWANMGIYTDAVAPEFWVHTLEHGAVAFLYHCSEGCDEEVQAITEIAEDDRPFALVTPYPDLPTRFAVVSWGHRLVTDCFDREAFEAFYAAHVDQAIESTLAPSPPPEDPSCQ